MNKRSVSMTTLIDSTFPLEKIIKLSTKHRWDNLNLTHLQLKLNFGLVAHICIRTENTSMTSTNRKGDKGSPYLKSLELGKRLANAPFREIENWAVVAHSIIRFTNQWGKSYTNNTSLRNPHSTASYAFIRSIFNVHRSNPLDEWYAWTNSCANKILSAIHHPYIKADCSFPTKKGRGAFIRLAIIFAMHL